MAAAFSGAAVNDHHGIWARPFRARGPSSSTCICPGAGRGSLDEAGVEGQSGPPGQVGKADLVGGELLQRVDRAQALERLGNQERPGPQALPGRLVDQDLPEHQRHLHTPIHRVIRSQDGPGEDADPGAARRGQDRVLQPSPDAVLPGLG